ncbi:MAG TPA: YihY family inner membrane protein, partial [Burkholderiaceae bacterium]|nr:YihY family inner membrane protein [Burkholderiaceae bacterium]
MWASRLRASGDERLTLRQRLERIGPKLERAREVLAFATQRTREVRLLEAAASLTFTTVLSLVPLFAVVLAIFTAFPLFNEFRVALEKNLFRELLPEQYAPVILRYLNNFAAKAGQLTAVGLAFLVVTAIMMIFTVERALNDIWGVRVRRSLSQRILIYWALLTLGPLLIGASLSATSYLASMSAGWVRQVPSGVRTVLDLLPVVLGGLALTVMYVVVPQRKVLWGDALIGGFTAAVISEIMREGFGVYLRAGTVANVYGAFAIVPLFLLWVYLSWLTVLFGAAITANLPMLRSTRLADERRAGNRFLTSMALLQELMHAFQSARQHGVPAVRSTRELAHVVRTAPDEVERLLEALQQMEYVARIAGDENDRWVLICDPARTDAVAVFKRFAVDPANTL